MKKHKKVSTTELPKDFLTQELPPNIAPVETLPVETSPLAVPKIDINAELKNEQLDTQAEEIPLSEKTGKSLFVLGSILGIIILVGVFALSFFYLKISDKKTVVENVPTIQTTPTPTVISIKNSDITFEVLNGSGVSGAAAKAGKQLETLGFTVESLGNAEDTQTGTTVFIAENLTAQKETLMTNIKEEFPEAIYSGVLTGSTAKVKLTIGK